MEKCEGALVYNQGALSIEMHMCAKNVSHEDFLERLAERCKGLPLTYAYYSNNKTSPPVHVHF